jgi:hypothetical protein
MRHRVYYLFLYRLSRRRVYRVGYHYLSRMFLGNPPTIPYPIRSGAALSADLTEPSNS